MSAAGSGGRIQPARPGDPSRIGPYRVAGRLGAGGMGTVFAATAGDGTRVAVKVIHPSQAGDPEFRARFRREVQLSARVQGPCLLPLLAADPDADSPWLATAYVAGPTLAQHLAAHGPLADGVLYAFATGTAQALEAIHAAGVVHRDVKPQNVLLAPAGPRMVDFGIAHALDGTSVTRTGVVTGTPGWISPEHYRGGVAGAPGDLFAWGALVAYAATARLPFGGGPAEAVAYRVTTGEPDLEGVPEQLRDILESALAKEPAERTTAAEAAAGCARLLAAASTRVIGSGTAARAGHEAAAMQELVTAQWCVPAWQEDTWPRAAGGTGRRSRHRAVAAVLATAAVAGMCVGGVLALRPDGGGPAKDGGAPARSAGSGTKERASGAAGGQSAAPGGDARGRQDTDPRTVAVPTDPLAGVADPAFTRTGDEDQPAPGEWNASSAAAGPAEADAAAAIGAEVTRMLATKDMAFMKATVTFNRRAQTVVVTAGPVSTLTDDYKEVFHRAGATAACTTLAHRLKDAPTSWPYGRFSVYWKDFDGQDEATILGFGEATDGCYTGSAGQREGSEEGLTTATFPSSDKSEIQVAGRTAKALTAAWRTRVAEGHGLTPFDSDDAITLGFDPVEDTLYVWVNDTSDTLAGRAQQSHFRDVVERTACPRLLAEYNAGRRWNYTHWSAAVFQGNSPAPQFVGSGDCLPAKRRGGS
ncbi:serine/threonine-protein kinase [Streptomyces fructofermentans]|uniref:serine/threonine-protein kinase n=1 Tax=Streptomyces fructofermentans TaxID=152141 RepID=UPI0037A2F813